MSANSDVEFTLGKNSNGEIVVERQYILHPRKCKNSLEDIAIMQYKINQDPHCITRKIYSPTYSEKQTTAIVDSILLDHDKCLSFMIKNGGNLNDFHSFSSYGIVDYCLQYNRLKVLKYVISNDIISATYNSGDITKDIGPFRSNYYVYQAVLYQGPSIIKLLLDHGADVDDFSNFEMTMKECTLYSPLVNSIEDPEILKLLLLNGGAIDFRQTNRSDLSPNVKDCLSLIHHFALSAFLNSHKMLLVLNILYEFGANLWETNKYGLTPLEMRQNPVIMRREFRNRCPFFDDNFTSQDVFASLKISEKLQELMGKPLSLKSLVRVSLMRNFGKRYLNCVEELERLLPNDILKFLCAEDLQVNVTETEILMETE